MDGDKSVYAAFIPTSPDRHVFKEFKEMHSFLNSSENKKLNKGKLLLGNFWIVLIVGS